MKRLSTFRSMVTVMVILFILPGCSKIIDYLEDHPDADLKYCNVKKFTATYFGSTQEAVFSYNRLGNPVTVTLSQVGTAQPHLLLRYDDQNRLTECIGHYGNGFFDSWSKYYYDDKDRIAYDTTYWWGEGTDEPLSYYGKQLQRYEYDARNRITKVTIERIEPGAPPQVLSYAYDTRGNLVRDGVEYDNKINIHRTNKIWMFLGRDYSLNNPFTADTYNTNHLPLTMNASSHLTDTRFLHLYFGEATAEYMCK